MENCSHQQSFSALAISVLLLQLWEGSWLSETRFMSLKKYPASFGKTLLCLHLPRLGDSDLSYSYTYQQPVVWVCPSHSLAQWRGSAFTGSPTEAEKLWSRTFFLTKMKLTYIIESLDVGRSRRSRRGKSRSFLWKDCGRWLLSRALFAGSLRFSRPWANLCFGSCVSVLWVLFSALGYLFSSLWEVSPQLLMRISLDRKDWCDFP